MQCPGLITKGARAIGSMTTVPGMRTWLYLYYVSIMKVKEGTTTHFTVPRYEGGMP